MRNYLSNFIFVIPKLHNHNRKFTTPLREVSLLANRNGEEWLIQKKVWHPDMQRALGKLERWVDRNFISAKSYSWGGTASGTSTGPVLGSVWEMWTKRREPSKEPWKLLRDWNTLIMRKGREKGLGRKAYTYIYIYEIYIIWREGIRTVDPGFAQRYPVIGPPEGMGVN